MRVVIAIGGNALQRRGEALTAENMRKNVSVACRQIARVVPDNEIVIVHGNGPQIGLLALQNEAYLDVPAYPLDVLGAQTVGMIGYMLVQELSNELPPRIPVSVCLTQTEVQQDDPAFKAPTKPIGPVYTKEVAEKLAAEKGWTIAADGDHFRRVVPSPKPWRIVEVRPIRWMIEKGAVVICAGGGGVPTIMYEDGLRRGVEAVVDKDLSASLLSREITADYFIVATDVDAVYTDWGKPEQRAIRKAHPDALEKMGFASGSMGPKVEACIDFVRATGRKAVIGALDDLSDILCDKAGTIVTTEVNGIEWAPAAKPAPAAKSKKVA